MLNDLSIGSEQSQTFEKFCKENPAVTGYVCVCMYASIFVFVCWK
jgi:hypothetical protein